MSSPSSGRRRGTRKLVVIGLPYVIIYRAVGDVVRIAAVWHCPAEIECPTPSGRPERFPARRCTDARTHVCVRTMSKRKRKHGPAERSRRRKAQQRRDAKMLVGCIADFELSEAHADTLRTCWQRDLVTIAPNNLGSFDVFFGDAIDEMPEMRALRDAMEACIASRMRDFTSDVIAHLKHMDPGDGLSTQAELLVNVTSARNSPITR